MILEKQLADALHSGDKKRIERIFHKIYMEYYGLVSFCIANYISNPLDVEEDANQVFLNFFNQLSTTTFSSIKYYLVQSAKHLAWNRLRREKEDIILDENLIYKKQALAPASIKHCELIEDLKTILTQEEYALLISYVLEDKSSKELAKELGITPESVRMKYHRILKKIRKALGGKEYA